MHLRERAAYRMDCPREFMAAGLVSSREIARSHFIVQPSHLFLPEIIPLTRYVTLPAPWISGLEMDWEGTADEQLAALAAVLRVFEQAAAYNLRLDWQTIEEFEAYGALHRLHSIMEDLRSWLLHPLPMGDRLGFDGEHFHVFSIVRRYP